MNHSSTLGIYRKQRGFCPIKYTQAKGILINSYLKAHNLNTVIVAVSGGIDSAVVLGLLNYASEMEDSPIKKVIAINIPIFHSGVSTNQDTAFEKSLELKNVFPNIEYASIDVSDVYSKCRDIVSNALHIPSNQWSSGQLVTNIRVPVIYFVSALFFKTNNNAVVCGTINRDEGGYVGFFGKASDNVVDLQLISDIHKSEVYKVASFLKIPENILKARPNGDLFNGLCDEDFLEVPYDFIELYSGYLSNEISPTKDSDWIRYANKMEYHHKKCIHKYYMPGSGVHLDVYDHDVKQYKPSFYGAAKTNFVNCASIEYTLQKNTSLFTKEEKLPGVEVLENLLSSEEIISLLESLQTQSWIQSDSHGRVYSSSTDKKGSTRISIYNEDFATELWWRIKRCISPILVLDPKELTTDHDGCCVWRAIGVNPYLRFMKYSGNEYLVPHYDSPHTYSSTTKTLKTIVIYLTTTKSGCTIFIKDTDTNSNFRDWNSLEEEKDIQLKVECQSGNALVFDHRKLHSGQVVSSDEQKIILRTDIVYEKCYSYGDQFNTEPLGLVSLANNTYLFDEYYMAASKYYSEKELLEAGYMAIERKSRPITFNFLGTPFHKINTQSQNPRKTILVSTGCFNPVHKGHIQMMENAKKMLEENGEDVIGGYLVVANKSYIQTKVNSVNICEIIKQAEKAVLNSNWLMVDPYECLYESNDQNFTSILERIHSYILRNFDLDVSITYVCGGDNARFTRAFVGKGRCICVKRAGFEHIFEAYKKELENSKSVHFIDGLPIEISSTHLRELFIPSKESILFANYIVNEDSECEGNSKLTKESILAFNNTIFSLLGTFISCEKFIFNKVAPIYSTSNEISLFCYYKTKHTLSISRQFHIANYMCESRLTNSSPLFHSIEDQLKLIPQGSYDLVDDDSYTGYTTSRIKEILANHNIHIEKCSYTNKHIDDNVLDILDCRDLLVGRENGGAVCVLPNKKRTRVPYILPYCYPSKRLNINKNDDLDFSKKIWELNYEFYKQNKLTLRDVSKTTQDLFTFIGFNLDHPMSYICKCHLFYF